MKVTEAKASVCLECPEDPCWLDFKQACKILDGEGLKKKRIREREWRRKRRAGAPSPSPQPSPSRGEGGAAA